MLVSLAGAAACCIWLYLLLARGGFWRMRDRATPARPDGGAPAVVAVVPARNEALVIGGAVESLSKQNYSGAFHIVLVDDGSDDATAAVARQAAPAELLTILRGASLPEGWTGKLWAISQGLQQAVRFSPDYLLLTDADIVHPPGGLRDLVAQAIHGGYDMVSWMVLLRCQSWAERALIPAYVFFFLMLYPPAWTRSSRHRTAGAAGGCILIRREMLERIGGIARIRGELIDDCALARAVKQEGGQIWLGLTQEARSVRADETFGDVGRMISRTAFTELRHKLLFLAGTAAAMAITFLVPPVLAFTGNAFGIAAWLLMSGIYLPTLRFYRRSLLWAPLLPAIALFYLGATIHSAVAYWRGAGGVWKGRVQDPSKDGSD
jgi:hopene-associated glycosyltransferase HpnB